MGYLSYSSGVSLLSTSTSHNSTLTALPFASYIWTTCHSPHPPSNSFDSSSGGTPRSPDPEPCFRGPFLILLWSLSTYRPYIKWTARADSRLCPSALGQEVSYVTFNISALNGTLYYICRPGRRCTDPITCCEISSPLRSRQFL